MTRFADKSFTVPYMSPDYSANHAKVFGERKPCDTCGRFLSLTTTSSTCYACEIEVGYAVDKPRPVWPPQANPDAPGTTIKGPVTPRGPKATAGRKTQRRR